MQYLIGINQKQLLEICPNLDIQDAAIFDFISKYIGTNSIEKIIVEGKIYYWVSYKKIINELPILGIKSKSSIYKKIEKLINAELLERYQDNQLAGKTYFGAGKYYEYAFWENGSIKNYRGGRENFIEGGRENFIEGGRENFIDNQSTNYDQSTNYHNKEKEKKESQIKLNQESYENESKEETNNSLNSKGNFENTGSDFYENENLDNNKPKTFKKWTEDEFYKEIQRYSNQYSKKLLENFFNYWSESDEKGRMKFQMNKTWDTKKRLITWSNKSKAFNSNYKQANIYNQQEKSKEKSHVTDPTNYNPRTGGL